VILHLSVFSATIKRLARYISLEYNSEESEYEKPLVFFKHFLLFTEIFWNEVYFRYSTLLFFLSSLSSQKEGIHILFSPRKNTEEDINTIKQTKIIIDNEIFVYSVYSISHATDCCVFSL